MHKRLVIYWIGTALAIHYWDVITIFARACEYYRIIGLGFTLRRNSDRHTMIRIRRKENDTETNAPKLFDILCLVNGFWSRVSFRRY